MDAHNLTAIDLPKSIALHYRCSITSRGPVIDPVPV